MTSPDAEVRLGDVYDFEGVARSPIRYRDTVFIPAMELGLAGIAQLRKALDEGEAGITAYLARTAGQDAAPEPGAPLSEACAWGTQVPDFDQAAGGLPAWPEIKAHALSHLDAARNEMSGAGDWLRSIDSPLTPAEARSAREARKLSARIKDLIDEAKGALDG